MIDLPSHAFIDGVCVALHVPKGTRYATALGGAEAVSQDAAGKAGPVVVIRWPDGSAPCSVCAMIHSGSLGGVCSDHGLEAHPAVVGGSGR